MCVLRYCDGETSVLFTLRHFRVEECRRCGMRFRQPFPTAPGLRDMYEDPIYHASAYFSHQYAPGNGRAKPEARIHEEALRWLEMRPGAPLPSARTLLDVGCGTGFFLHLASRRGWRTVGVEFSDALATRAREAFGLDVHYADFLDAHLPESAFDVITMWDVLEHVLDPEEVLGRARTLLAPGGYLVIFTIDSGSLFNVLGHLSYRLVGCRARTLLDLLYDARHNYYFTRDSLCGLLEQCAFRTVAMSEHRAHLGRWLAEPASLPIRLAGDLVDLASVILGRQYRQLLYCQVTP